MHIWRRILRGDSPRTRATITVSKSAAAKSNATRPTQSVHPQSTLPPVAKSTRSAVLNVPSSSICAPLAPNDGNSNVTGYV